jgi:hypothetical protein
MKGMRNRAFLSVSKYGAVNLFESPGRAGGLSI